MDPKLNYPELIDRIHRLEHSELERRKIEHALRESEKRLELALEAGNSGVWDFNPRTFSDTHYNDRWFTMLGYEPDELPHTAETWTRLLHPEDLKRVQHKLQRHIDGKGDYAVEFRMKRKDGSYGWIHSIGNIVAWDDQGRPQRMIGIHQDITERVRGKEELDAHLHFLKSLECINEAILHAGDAKEMLHNAMDAVLSIFNCDRAWLLYPCDPHAASWHIPIERTRPEYQGAGGEEVFFPMTPDVVETFHQLLDQQEPVFDSVLPEENLWDINDKYGVRSFMSIAVHPQVGKAWDFGIHQCSHDRVWTNSEQRLFKEIGRRIGDVLSLYLVVSDLEKSELKFRNLVESSSDWIWEVDLDCVSSYSSPQAKDILGYPPEQIVGKSAFDFMAPEEALRIKPIFFEAIRDANSITRLTTTLQHKDGHPIVIETNGVPIFNDAGDLTGYRGVHRDITNRLKAQEQQQRLQAQLAQAQKMESIGRLAGGVAHDFNNMLSIILGNTEMIMEQIEPENSIKEGLGEIYNATQRSINLTRQLLAFARKQTVEPQVLDLNRTVGEMVKMLDRIIGEDINLCWQSGKGLWPVMIDPSQLDQILANLCINARDAINTVGTVTIELENISIDEPYSKEHAGFEPGDYVLIAVSDTGSGMDQQTIDNLFEPFYTTKGVGHGSGLGLATVYGIVKQNNGFIHVYSEIGKGSTFKVFLQRHGVAAKPAPIPKNPSSVQQGSETIMLVEDQSAILKMTAQMLERLGYRVLASTHPSDAIRMAKEFDARRIDLLVTDVVMQEMNGRELADRLLPQNPKLKCLFMSGYTADVIAQRGVLDEGVQFISKPFTKHDLATKVRGVIDAEE